MSNPFIGEIRIFAGNFAINGWAFCDGSLQPIAQNNALFTLIGTTYGGDGQTTFALPDLQGRVPIHPGAAYPIGARGGAENITLTAAQMPAHTHPFGTDTAGTTRTPTGVVPSQGVRQTYIPAASATGAMTPAPATVGASQPHNNMAPTLTLTYIVSLFGIFPSQN